MGRKRFPTPSRAEFEALWLDFSVTVKAMSQRFGVSEPTVNKWADRWGLSKRTSAWSRNRGTAKPIEIGAHENHCRPVNDGPLPGDPTPMDIAARAAELKAEHMRRMRDGLTA